MNLSVWISMIWAVYGVTYISINCCQKHWHLLPSPLSQRRRYCGSRCLSVCVCVSVCLSAEPRRQARRISLRGEGNALHPLPSSFGLWSLMSIRKVHYRPSSSHWYFGCNLDPEGGSQQATLVVVLLLVLGISSLKIPKDFLIWERSATKLCTRIRAHIPHRSTSQIFKLISN